MLGIHRFARARGLLFSIFVRIGELENQRTVRTHFIVRQQIIGAVIRPNDVPGTLIDADGIVVTRNRLVVDNTHFELADGQIAVAVGHRNADREINLIGLAMMHRALQLKGIAEIATRAIQGHLENRLAVCIHGRYGSAVR